MTDEQKVLYTGIFLMLFSAVLAVSVSLWFLLAMFIIYALGVYR